FFVVSSTHQCKAISALPEHGRMAMDNVAFVMEREVRSKKAKKIGCYLCFDEKEIRALEAKKRKK
ncbi:MAG: hypothetical protein AAB664_02240, partial [Patescibacteria group bacterium]